MSKKSDAHKNHLWVIGQPPPLIRAHSLAKHRVLRKYLERYVETLTANPRRDQMRLTLVDGFAGGGIYLDDRTKEERYGSPLLMLEAMKVAQAEAQKLRSKPFHLDVQYIFIEKDQNALEYLKKILAQSEYAKLLGERIQVLSGEFVDHAPDIVKFVKSRGTSGRAIFNLDQFGYKDAPLPVIRTILHELENAEVLLTFAADSLIDYLGDNEKYHKQLQSAGLNLSAAEIADARASRHWRRSIQYLLHREIPTVTGADYYTPFFIRSADSHRDFWLVHLSGHHKARDVMVGLHWQESTSFAHYGGSGLQMLGYHQSRDENLTHQPTLPGFFFDQTALVSSQEELIEQLPARVHEFSKGVSAESFFAKHTNEAPVTFEIMRGVLNELAASGQIIVRDKSGTRKRSSKITHASDIIEPSRQRRIRMGN